MIRAWVAGGAPRRSALRSFVPGILSVTELWKGSYWVPGRPGTVAVEYWLNSGCEYRLKISAAEGPVRAGQEKKAGLSSECFRV